VPKLILLGAMIATALVLSILFLPHLFIYLTLALAVASAGFLAPDESTRDPIKNFNQYASTAGKAAFLFAILASIVVFNHVAANRDVFFVKGVLGAAALANGVSGGTSVDTSPVTADQLANVSSFSRASYKAYMASLANNLGMTDQQKAAAAAQYDTDAAYASWLSSNAASLTAFKQSLQSGGSVSSGSSGIATGQGVTVTSGMVDAVKRNLAANPYGQTAYDNFPLAIAALAFAFLYIAKLFTQGIAGIAGAALSNL
jgi:hypothetical protein